MTNPDLFPISAWNINRKTAGNSRSPTPSPARDRPLNLEPSRKGQWLIPYLYRHKRQHSTDMMMGTTTHNQQEQYEVLFLNQIMLWNLPIS